ncbi:GNAT family N-acetyltransferase [Streptomyces goshikiensis]|uniref:GNAT family N-acetyltransferase n=1 Tax=Streptomyces goshikiensis TaxID=1942 RepID=UPI00381EB875
MPRYETWVADTGSTVAGLLVLDGNDLRQLYLDPAWRGQGLGDRFIALAKQQAGRADAVDVPGQRGGPAVRRTTRLR